MIKRCLECSATIDSGKLCDACYKAANEQTIKLVVDSKNGIAEVATNMPKEQLIVFGKLEEKGLKYDQGKPDLSILPIEALEAMAAAFTYGAKKYQRNNFKKGIEVNRTLAAALRHIYAKLNKQDFDIESGVDHLGHALAAIAMAIYTLKHKPELDDR